MRRLCALVFCLAACDSPTPDASGLLRRTPAPIVLITMDTTRPDHLSPYGKKDIETPTLQKLAQRGVVFEEAYAVAPITLVAHTSILSGQYPTKHGVRNNGIHHVPENTPLLSSTLKRAGYQTGAFVAAAVLERRYGLARGFDVYDDNLSTGTSRAPRMVPDRPAGAVVDNATRWLDSLDEEKPFFLWVHFYDPHASYTPPPPFRDTYRERPYDGEIAYMDHELGRLLAHPRVQKAWVMATADHGEAFGEHGENTHGLLVHDATLKIPFILAGPGIKKPARSRLPVSQVDVAPTLLDLVGVETPEPLDGQSLARVNKGPRLLYSESYLPFYTYGWAKLHAAHRGPWKYVEAPTEQLFNTKEDPRELSNVATARPNERHDLARDLKTVTGTSDANKETRLDVDTSTLEALRALGYVNAGTSDRYAQGERPDPNVFIKYHALLERARHHQRDGLHGHAERALREVLQNDPNNISALMDLSSVLAAQTKLDDARNTMKRVIELDGTYARGFLNLAQLELRQGNIAEAQKLATRALELDAKFVEAGVLLTHILAKTAPKEAPAQAMRLLDEHGTEPAVLTMYAEVVDLSQGALDQAIARLREATQRDPFYAQAFLVLGGALSLKNEPQEARKAYKDGLLRNVDHAGLHAELGLLSIRTGDKQEAEMHLREAIRLSSKVRSDVYTALGALLADAGRTEEAKHYYAQVLADSPRHPAARNNRAVALLREGKVAEAKRELSELVAEFPRHADAYNNLAGLAVTEGAWTEALKLAQKAVELSPKAHEPWTNLGVALDELGRNTEAQKALETALDLAPSYWEARLNLGMVLRELGQHEQAVRHLEQVIIDAPGVPDTYRELGLAYAGPLKDPKLARQHLQAFLRRVPRTDPGYQEAVQVLDRLPMAQAAKEK